ncbi:hypothetical protein TruAng_002626 [Truncatella angustata]|nr:hypothetical protein TruAng_002626 [Truncatella angustata]
MVNPTRYWPGGIPENIRLHPQPVVSSLKEMVKGWQLFLEVADSPIPPPTQKHVGQLVVDFRQENAIPRSSAEQDASFEMQLRRRLMQQWASMSQGERDEYQNRAPARPKDSWYPAQLRSSGPPEIVKMVNCIAPWPLSPRNRALWTKLRVMLYCLDGDNGALFGEEDGEVAVPEPNPTGPNPLTPQEFLKWCYVESADLAHIAMISDGTVICHNWQSTVLFADQQSLETGLMLLCDIENNGQVMCKGRVWPVLMKDAYVSMTASGKSVKAILDQDMFKAPIESRNVNMEDTMINILDSKAAYLNNADIDIWEEAIERCAPGYLELEEAGGGMAFNYDHAKFRSHEELEQMPWTGQ